MDSLWLQPPEPCFLSEAAREAGPLGSAQGKARFSPRRCCQPAAPMVRGKGAGTPSHTGEPWGGQHLPASSSLRTLPHPSEIFLSTGPPLPLDCQKVVLRCLSVLGSSERLGDCIGNTLIFGSVLQTTLLPKAGSLCWT